MPKLLTNLTIIVSYAWSLPYSQPALLLTAPIQRPIPSSHCHLSSLQVSKKTCQRLPATCSRISLDSACVDAAPWTWQGVHLIGYNPASPSVPEQCNRVRCRYGKQSGKQCLVSYNPGDTSEQAQEIIFLSENKSAGCESRQRWTASVGRPPRRSMKRDGLGRCAWHDHA